MYQILISQNDKLEIIDNIVPGAWINMLDPTETEIQEICNILNIEIDFIKAALDEEERPRIECENGKTLIVADIPIVEAGERKTFMYSTMPMGIIVCEDNIVTVCLKKSQLVKDFLSNRVKTFYTFKKNRFLLLLLYRAATHYLQYLRQIDKISNNIENDLHRSMKNKELIMLLTLEKSLVFFSTSLKSNEIVLEKLLKIPYANIQVKKYPDDEDLLDDVIVENKQAIEMANIYSNILSGTMDAFASIISNNLNIVMKFLAAITIVMAIPNIVGSFFGMNVGGIPFAQYPYGFVIILGISALLCGVVAFLLSKKKMF